jgi:8-oxo-dGTP pyrophosphatase MutT (NUDIX family)
VRRNVETMSNTTKMSQVQYEEVVQDRLTVVFEDLAARFILTCPVEEFESFERLFFQIEAAHWFYIDNCVESDPYLPKFGMKEFARRLFQHCPMLKKFQASVEAHFVKFSQYKVCVPVCGAIILNPVLDKCLLVKGWSKNATWGFPKGKINKNETELACATREVQEEVGFNVSNVINERDTITATINNNDNEQTIKLYIIPGVSEDTYFETQTRKEISKISWFPVKDLPCSGMPGRDFFLVRPFVKQLNEWIKCRKGGKQWAGRQTPTQCAKVPPKGQKESRRTSSVPTQRPEKHHDLDGAAEPHHALELGRSGSFSAEDMFRVNEERYGVKSTYQFELYTTQLKSARSGKAAASEAAAPGGGYRQCTVKDHPTPSTQSPSGQGSPSHRGQGSSDMGSKSPVASHQRAGSGPSPPRGNQRTADSKRRKGEQSTASARENGQAPLDTQQFACSEIEALLGAEMGRSSPVPENVEFGKGFKFNTLEVMAPILAMS